jgi:cytochrome c-type biogenesis protein CcmH
MTVGGWAAKTISLVNSALGARFEPRIALVPVAALLLIAAASNDPADRLPNPQQEARARALFRDIRCLVCQNQSIDESDADLAEDLRKIVRGNALLWGAPFAVVIVGGVVLIARGRKGLPEQAPLSEEEEAKLTEISSNLS